MGFFDADEEERTMKKLLLPLFVAAFTLTMAIQAFGGHDAKNNATEAYDEDTYGPAAPIVWTKPVEAVVFEHKVHTMGAGLECDSCHDDVFAQEAGAAQENDDFNMKALYDGKYCGTCHDGSTAFASNTRCTSCHIGLRGHKRMNGEGSGAEKSHE
jgi:c(7)-type cytochrome triheme protein